MMGSRHVALRATGEIFGYGFGSQCSARRLQHRAADALNETRNDQLQHGLRETAQKRARRKNDKPQGEHFLASP